jgi:predicted permease
MFDRLLQDLRFAVRQLLRRPAFSVLLILTISVAIGANVAIFSVLEGIVLRPMSYHQPERLLAVWETPPEGRWYQPFSAPDYFDVREQSETLEEFGVIHLRWFNLSGGEEPQRVRGGACTASLLNLLGVQPAQGRLFTEEEEAEGNDRVVILSHGLWRNQFGGDPDILGNEVSINGEPSEVIGIMPEGFRSPTPWGGRDGSRLWTPIVLDRYDNAGRGSHWLGAYGRMAENATPEQVEAELDLIATQLAEAYPDTNGRVRMWVQPMMERTLGGIGSALAFLLVIVGLVLLIACANVASMLLARGLNRSGEFAIRASMGAGRRRLARQLLTESLVLAGIGGILGVLMAYWGVDALKAVLPDNVPRVDGISVNGPVLGFAFVATLVTGLLVGLAPSLFASRTNLAEVIKTGRATRGGGSAKNRFLWGLVAVQLGLGFVLVNAALVMAVSYGNVIKQPNNFQEEVLVASISVQGPRYSQPQQRRTFWEQVLDRTRSLPGVTEAGITSKLPLQGGSNGGVLVRDQVFDPQGAYTLVEYSFVSERYLEAMGIPLLTGRTFDRGDMEAAAVYAGIDSVTAEVPLVINRAMAEELWPESDALGEMVRPFSPQVHWRGRVVGIVENVRQWGPEREALPEMYFPHTAEVWGPIWGNVIVKAEVTPEALAEQIKGAVHEVDAEIPVATPFTMARIVRTTTAGRRFSMLLVALFAATALLLIVAGTYGVISYAVSQRTHEIGVRMTLGADKTRVLRLFLVRVASLFGVGLALGLLGAFATGIIIRSMVYGISALSPLHMAAAAGVMILVALSATLIPVMRATGVDPLEALRIE